MFLLVYNHLKLKMMLLLPFDLVCIYNPSISLEGAGPFESTMLHHHVSTVAQDKRNTSWERGSQVFFFFFFFLCTTARCHQILQTGPLPIISVTNKSNIIYHMV